MANMCYNQLSFSGAVKNLKNVKDCFIQMRIEEERTNKGQIPPFQKEVQQGYFFNILAYESDDIISFESRWESNIKDIILIANYFKVGFEIVYQEMGNLIFGKAIGKLQNGKITLEEYNLDSSDIDAITEVENGYILNDTLYECEDDALEDIFEKKFGITY